MTKPFTFVSIVSFFFISTHIFSQNKSKGPIIVEYGEVFEVENPEFKTDVAKEYKAVFDIMNSPESHTDINKSIETAARFLNMHAQAGVSKNQLKAALVVHNAASKDIITNEAYQKKYGTDNPNLELVQVLLDADVQIIFCGQSSAARGFPKEELIDGVQLSLSAMTALIDFQGQGFSLIKF